VNLGYVNSLSRNRNPRRVCFSVALAHLAAGDTSSPRRGSRYPMRSSQASLLLVSPMRTPPPKHRHTKLVSEIHQGASPTMVGISDPEGSGTKLQDTLTSVLAQLTSINNRLDSHGRGVWPAPSGSSAARIQAPRNLAATPANRKTSRTTTAPSTTSAPAISAAVVAAAVLAAMAAVAPSAVTVAATPAIANPTTGEAHFPTLRW